MIKAYTLEELKRMLTKAFEKHEVKKPKAVMKEFGFYEVTGSRGVYGIRCGRTERGEFFIACVCRGALNGYGCYHAAAAFLLHVEEAQRQIDARRAPVTPENTTYLPPSSGKKPEKVGNIRV